MERVCYFKKNLHHLRTINKEQPNVLATALGVSPQSICQWEKDENRMPRLNRLADIAHHYQVSIDELVYCDLTYKHIPVYPSDLSNLSGLAKRAIPLINSDEAMRYKPFRTGVKLYSDAINSPEGDFWEQISAAGDAFEAAFREHDCIEAACNYLAILLFISSIIAYPDLYEKFEHIMTVPRLIVRKFRNIDLGNDPIHIQAHDFDHLHFCVLIDETINELLMRIKHSVYTELADYYVALRYHLGLVCNRKSWAENQAFALELTHVLRDLDNPYIKDMDLAMEELQLVPDRVPGFD